MKPIVRCLEAWTPDGDRMLVCVLDHPGFAPHTRVRTSRVVAQGDGWFETLNHRYVRIVGPSLPDVRALLREIAHGAKPQRKEDGHVQG